VSVTPSAFLVQMPLWAREPSMAIAQLYAFLRQEGYPTTVMDVNSGLYNRHNSPGYNLWSAETNEIWGQDALPAEIMEKNRAWIESEYLRPIAAAERPVVGFSVTSCSFPASLIMARWIKALRPDALVLFGGQIFTTTSSTVETIIAHPEVDAVVAGDGEYVFADALACARLGRTLDACRGLFVRGADGRAAFTGERPPADLDALPFADFSPFDMSLYGTEIVGPHDLALMTNRGCVRRCSFCGHRTAWRGFRQMSGERVHAEIAHQRKVMPTLGHEDSEIKFYDLLINGDMKKLTRLAQLLAAEDKPRLPWKEANAVIRPEMTRDVCRTLYEGGCRELIIGLESGSQNVLDAMDKGQTVAQMKSVLKEIDAGGLKTRGNFMFGHPGETQEDFEATLDFIREMHPFIHTIYPSYTLTHLDGRLIREPEKWGLSAGQHPLYWRSPDGTNTYPVRLQRFKAFRELATSLGANVVDGLQMSVEAYVDFSLAGYHEAQSRPADALRHYRSYLGQDPTNEYAANKVRDLERSLGAAA
jgi:hypothetical protein